MNPIFRFFLCLVVSLHSFAVAAQSDEAKERLVGTWKQCLHPVKNAKVPIDSSYTCDEPWTYTLHPDGTLSENNSIIYYGKEYPIGGTWKLVGTVLTIQPTVAVEGVAYGAHVFQIIWINPEKWVHASGKTEEGYFHIYFEKLSTK